MVYTNNPVSKYGSANEASTVLKINRPEIYDSPDFKLYHYGNKYLLADFNKEHRYYFWGGKTTNHIDTEQIIETLDNIVKSGFKDQSAIILKAPIFSRDEILTNSPEYTILVESLKRNIPIILFAPIFAGLWPGLIKNKLGYEFNPETSLIISENGFNSNVDDGGISVFARLGFWASHANEFGLTSVLNENKIDLNSSGSEPINVNLKNRKGGQLKRIASGQELIAKLIDKEIDASPKQSNFNIMTTSNQNKLSIISNTSNKIIEKEKIKGRYKKIYYEYAVKGDDNYDNYKQYISLSKTHNISANIDGVEYPVIILDNGEGEFSNPQYELEYRSLMGADYLYFIDKQNKKQLFMTEELANKLSKVSNDFNDKIKNKEIKFNSIKEIKEWCKPLPPIIVFHYVIDKRQLRISNNIPKLKINKLSIRKRIKPEIKVGDNKENIESGKPVLTEKGDPVYLRYTTSNIDIGIKKTIIDPRSKPLMRITIAGSRFGLYRGKDMYFDEISRVLNEFKNGQLLSKYRIVK